jgi:4-amino-4-deoxy-L-arabinose transferase-like glycosyltransferase
MSSGEPAARDSDWVDRLRWWHLAAVFLLFVGTGLASMPLFEPDEGRYGEIPREMLESGDLVTPRLNGVLYFEKPALYYWLTAASIGVVGRNELGVRLPSAATGLAGLLLTYALGLSMGGRRLAVLATLVLGVSPMWIALARTSTIDMTVSALILATLACFWWAHQRSTGAAWAWYGMVVASALAVLAKGLIGLVIPGAVIFFYLLASRRWRVLRQVPWITGTLLFSAVAVPWHVLVAQRNPSFLWFYFVNEHLLRFATHGHERNGPIWYFLPVVIVGLLPWSGLLPAAAGLLSGARGRSRRPELLFLGAWAGFVLLFFSVSSSKLIPYILPGMPPLALLCAFALLDAETRGGRLAVAARWGLGAACAFLLLLLGAFVWVATGHGEELWNGEPIHFPVVTLVASTGAALAVVAAGRLRRGRWPAAVLTLALAGASLVACLLLSASEVAHIRSAKAVAACLERQPRPPRNLASYRAYPQTLPFYLGRQIDLVDYQGELGFGISKLSDAERRQRFPTASEFIGRWQGEEVVYLVTSRRHLADMTVAGLRPASVLFEAQNYLLFVNRLTSETTRCDG